ncbi:MAG: plasmid mobilization relaxosome protein MobC, partial [Pseudomonas sp.]
DAVLKNKTQIVARAKSSPERGRLVYLMNKASNNINQLAHRANADNLTGVISEETYACVLRELEVVSRAMKRAAFDAD